MKPKDSKGRKPALEDLLEIDEDLPPMDHDETIEPSSEELAALISPFNEKESQENFEQMNHSDDDLLDEETIEAMEESSWIEEKGEKAESAVDVSVDFSEDDWGDESEGDDLGLEDNWFADEEEYVGTEEDGGKEGPMGNLADEFKIDPDHWEELPDDLDEEDSHGPTDDLFIELPPAEEDGNFETGLGSLIDGQFLGPTNGVIRAADFMGGSPIGVGDGLFIIGADGMLHPAVGAQILSEMNATTICSNSEVIFIGTMCGGAFLTRNKGKTLKQINGWYAQGLKSEDQTSFERVSTSFDLLGHTVPYGYRLIGRTGNGQLFISHDYGRIWRGLVTPGNCMGLSAVSDSTEIIALFNVRNYGVGLFRNRDLLEWEQLSLPRPLAASVPGQIFHIAAGGETVVLAIEESPHSLFYSLNGGRDWTPAQGVKGVTALALDPNDPGWMAAALFDRDANMGLIRISEDGGRTWKTVYSIGEEDDGPRAKTAAGSGNRIHSLAINAGREREVIAVTDRGAHLITLARRDVSH